MGGEGKQLVGHKPVVRRGRLLVVLLLLVLVVVVLVGGAEAGGAEGGGAEVGGGRGEERLEQDRRPGVAVERLLRRGDLPPVNLELVDTMAWREGVGVAKVSPIQSLFIDTESIYRYRVYL